MPLQMAFASKHREKAEPGPAHRKPQHAPEVPHRTAVGVPVYLQRSSSASSSPPAPAGPDLAPSSSGHPLFQTPLAVGGVDDPAEHQADAVAAAVTAAPPASPSPTSPSAARVASTAPGATASSSVLRRELAASLAPSSPAAASPASPAATASARPAVPSSASPLPGHGPGTSMAPRTRSVLESRLGVDLGAVRVHRGPAAHEAAAALGARAFAAGSHIWLGRGESDEDVALMAHETAHVLQQDGVVRRAPAAAPPAGAKKGAPKGEKGGAAKGGAPPAAAPAPAASGGEGAAAAPVPMQMPEPPAGMSADERARLESVQQSNAEVAETAAGLPPAEEQTADARGAVSEPAAETEARSQEDVVATLDEREPPSPEIEELCERIRTVIREKRPPNEDRLVEAQPDEMARQAGTQVQGDVQGEADRVAGSYDSMDSPPAGQPEQTADPLETPAASVDARPADASRAAPDAVPAENVSLEADTAASAQQIEDAGMNGEVAAEAARGDPGGPIAEARGAQGELAETARRDPAEVMRQQREALSRAEADMAQLQAGALEVLRAARSGTVRSTSGQQAQMVGSEEQMRQQAGERSRAIFADAQTRVNALLEPLPRTAMARWDAGKEILAEEFKQSLAEVKRWIDERHAGIGGALVAGLDYLTGLPDWITRAYDRAEQRFGDGICSLAREISRDVNTAVAACEAIVTEARRQISELFASLPASLQEWAQGEQARLGEQLDGLRDRATEARATLNRDLVQRAGSAVQEAREQIHALRRAAGGLLGRIRDAVGRFLDDPAKFIIDGLLSLVGIDPGAFWALVARVQQVVHDIADNPMGFANNLMRGIAQGFRQFFANIGTHLLNGFMGWLFGGLAAAGITIPRDFSLKSIVTFVLQLMGITWARIRQVLARHVGERNVALLERAYELVSTLIEKGPEGIFEMIQDRLNPQQIIDQIIQAGISYLTERLITMVSVRIMGMLNPAGAIAQAIEAIYRVLKWVFENAARIFQFVEAVVNGMAAIVAGNIGGMANAVERALATLIAPVIDFLADYMGFGDLPERIKETIEGFQAWVMGHIDRAVGWLVERARALLARMGIGGGQQPGQQGGGDGELGETVRFSAGHEGHRLWVQTEGNRATLMVASDNPGPVETKLADWSGRLDTLPETREGGGNPRQEARGLIGDARTLLGQADTEADQLAAAIQRNAGAAPAAAGADGAAAAPAPNDDPLEAKQRALANVLQRLFDLFGGGGRPFATIQRSAAMRGGTEPVEIRAEGNGVRLFIGGVAGLARLTAVGSGPLAGGANQAGTRLVQGVGNQVGPAVQQVEAVRLLNGKVEEGDNTRLEGIATAAATEVGRLGPALRVPDLARAARVGPMDPAFPVEFGYDTSHNARYNGKFLEELEAQLARQQRGLNDMTIDRWALNVNIYRMDATDLARLDSSAREAVLSELRTRAATAATRARGKQADYLAAVAEIDAARAASRPVNRAMVEVVSGRYGNETEWRDAHSAGIAALYVRLQAQDARWAIISRTLDRLAVLHNPDQVAGGAGEIPDIAIPPTSTDVTAWEQYMQALEQVIGAKRVNSAIGASWGHQMPDVYARVTADYPQEGWPIWKLNFLLRTVRRS